MSFGKKKLYAESLRKFEISMENPTRGCFGWRHLGLEYTHGGLQSKHPLSIHYIEVYDEENNEGDPFTIAVIKIADTKDRTAASEMLGHFPSKIRRHVHFF